MSGDIPKCKIYMLQLTDSSMNMITSLEECVQLIDDNGGFAWVGWYKRGVINDKILIAARNINGVNSRGVNGNLKNNNNEEMQVDYGEIGYHIDNIIPNNRDYLDKNTHLGGKLCNIKVYVTIIDN